MQLLMQLTKRKKKKNNNMKVISRLATKTMADTVAKRQAVSIAVSTVAVQQYR